MAHNGIHAVSVVIPVYSGGNTLPALMSELKALTQPQMTPYGISFVVSEVLLVWDGGSAQSAAVLREIEAEYTWARAIWLSRNYGQHAATLAGMSSTSSEWVVTLDEDGQHDPAFIGQLLDCALSESAQLVYAAPTNGRPHGFFRNASSAIARWLFYLDVALSWVVSRSAVTPIPMRSEGREASNYSSKKLVAHFGRLVISSGTRPLILVSVIGFVFFMLGILFSLWVLFQRFFTDTVPQGWTSSFVATLVIGGLTLLSLGVIAQYLRTAVNMSLGKPLYVVVEDPKNHFPKITTIEN
jgi:glycosyltransferase involved in cell wall biosynthesis